MATVFDVAAYILKKKGPVTTWKLQKLVYYSQAWSLVWEDEPLFSEPIQAWINGPVCPVLYHKHRGQFTIRKIVGGDPDALKPHEKESVDVILAEYGDKSPQWLSDMTHMEDPWRNAREGIPDGERGESVISQESMAEHYESLLEGDGLPPEEMYP